MIVGLTGGIGSGKTTVANFFSILPDVVIYLADIEAKKLMNTSKIIQQKIMNAFGENAYKNGELQRAFLAKIVFNNPEKLSILNSIVHPEVRKHFQQFVENNQDKKLIIYENAILFESKSNQFCDLIICVISDLDTRIQRVMQRDDANREAVMERIKNQLSDDAKMLQSNYIILNENLQNTEKQVNSIYNILTKNQSLV